MGIATHLGPWLLGTVKNTTGTTAGTIRNVGATPVVQVKAVAFGDGAATVAFVLPAGSMIQNMQFNCYGAVFGAGTMVVSIGATPISGTFTLPTAFGVSAVTFATTQAGATLVANVGTTDAIVTYTLSSATLGSGSLIIAYTVRNPDGTYAPTSFTGP